MSKTPTLRRRYKVVTCPISAAAAKDCPHCASVRANWKGRLPKATLQAMRETEDIIAHPDKYPGMTFAEYVAWAHSL